MSISKSRKIKKNAKFENVILEYKEKCVKMTHNYIFLKKEGIIQMAEIAPFE